MPGAAGRETERRAIAPPPLVFFWTVRLTPHDRNHRNVRATRCRTPSGFGVLADVQAANASLDQTVQKKKSKDQSTHTKGRNTMASASIKENPTTTQSDLLRNAFDEWLDGLDTDHPTLTTHSMEVLAKAMGRNMAVRDAILLSVICSNSPEYDTDKLREYAFNPMRREQLAAWCERMMTWSFRRAGSKKDTSKVAKAIEMLSDIVGNVESIDVKLQAQPFAVIGYMLWWMGDKRAMLCAMRAVALDEECSLAAIVVAAIHGDRWPGRD